VPWAIAEVSAHAKVPLSTVIGAVAAVGLVAMAVAVISLRRYLVPGTAGTADEIPSAELLAS
jgi:hypothetical protein